MALKADKVRVIDRATTSGLRTGRHVLGRLSTIHDFVGLNRLRGQSRPGTGRLLGRGLFALLDEPARLRVQRVQGVGQFNAGPFALGIETFEVEDAPLATSGMTTSSWWTRRS